MTRELAKVLTIDMIINAIIKDSYPLAVAQELAKVVTLDMKMNNNNEINKSKEQ